MPLAIWKPEYATGNGAIDQQHQRLFEMVNGLHEGIVNGSGKEIMGPTLKKLAAYTLEHFRTEEGFMTSKKYPGYDVHHKKHDDLVKQVQELIASYDAGKMVLPLTLSRFLADWITHHIAEEDKALAAWLRTKD